MKTARMKFLHYHAHFCMTTPPYYNVCQKIWGGLNLAPPYLHPCTLREDVAHIHTHAHTHHVKYELHHPGASRACMSKYIKGPRASDHTRWAMHAQLFLQLEHLLWPYHGLTLRRNPQSGESLQRSPEQSGLSVQIRNGYVVYQDDRVNTVVKHVRFCLLKFLLPCQYHFTYRTWMMTKR